MGDQPSIRYLSHHEINRDQWDDCIRQADNGLIYGYSWYLDTTAGNWDGLVSGNYEAVMPLPWRQKFGIRYIYQPFLTAQLGVFGKTITKELVESFLSRIPQRFKLLEFPLNYRNVFSLPAHGYYVRMNYVLDLQKDYSSIHAAYRENVRRNVKKALQYGCIIKRNIPVREIVRLSHSYHNGLTKAEGERFSMLTDQLMKSGQSLTYGVLSKNEELLAGAVFLFANDRAYYILVGNHPNGKTLGASHLLIDSFIKDHAGQQLLLDFEGSDIQSLAFFYTSFGAVEEPYGAIRMNRLPFWARMMKKVGNSQ